MLQGLAYRLISTALLFCAPASTDSPVQGPADDQVKAAFLYKFVKFVAWPETLAEQHGPMLMCVIGKDPFGDALVRVIEGKKVNGRPMAVRQVNSLAGAVSCHVLFVSLSESKRLAEIVKAVHAWSVLTVGESDGFTEQGGMVTFFMEGHRLRFQINLKAATDAGLIISSKLMQLAAPASGNRGKH